jgi:alkylated DNA repair dioxygenase AlkB
MQTAALGLGWHEDKDKPDIIGSVSLGAQRSFCFGVGAVMKCKEVWWIQSHHGSLLLIPAETNAATKHRVPCRHQARQRR